MAEKGRSIFPENPSALPPYWQRMSRRRHRHPVWPAALACIGRSVRRAVARSLRTANAVLVLLPLPISRLTTTKTASIGEGAQQRKVIECLLTHHLTLWKRYAEHPLLCQQGEQVSLTLPADTLSTRSGVGRCCSTVIASWERPQPSHLEASTGPPVTGTEMVRTSLPDAVKSVTRERATSLTQRVSRSHPMAIGLRSSPGPLPLREKMIGRSAPRTMAIYGPGKNTVAKVPPGPGLTAAIRASGRSSVCSEITVPRMSGRACARRPLGRRAIDSATIPVDNATSGTVSSPQRNHTGAESTVPTLHLPIPKSTSRRQNSVNIMG